MNFSKNNGFYAHKILKPNSKAGYNLFKLINSLSLLVDWLDLFAPYNIIIVISRIFSDIPRIIIFESTCLVYTEDVDQHRGLSWAIARDNIKECTRVSYYKQVLLLKSIVLFFDWQNKHSIVHCTLLRCMNGQYATVSKHC